MSEVYNYIERLPKSFDEQFQRCDDYCRVVIDKFTFYIDVLDVIFDSMIDDFNFLVDSIKIIETNGKRLTDRFSIRELLKRCHPGVIDLLTNATEHLRVAYIYHHIQFIPFILKQIDEGSGRAHWKIFKSLGFKNIRDKDFLKILSVPFLFHWTINNIHKDEEEEFEKFKSLQLFINPNLYKDVYKQQELTKELKKKVDVISFQIKDMRRK